MGKQLIRIEQEVSKNPKQKEIKFIKNALMQIRPYLNL